MMEIINRWPAIGLPEAFHVGDFQAADKSRQGTSQEGNGLSISQNPNTWARIARLSAHQLFRLTKPSGTFLNYRNRDEVQVAQARDLSLAEGWITLESRWRVEWEDAELNEITFLLTRSADAAQAEAEDLADSAAQVKTIIHPCATKKLVQRIGFAVDDLLAEELALTCLVEDHTQLDGIWWDDRLDEAALSAPRGVINLRQLPTWRIESLGSLDPHGED